MSSGETRSARKRLHRKAARLREARAKKAGTTARKPISVPADVRRIGQALEWIAEGKARHWKYQ